MGRTFESRRKRKINKLNNDVKLVIDYESVPKDDIYGYYIMNMMEESSIYGLPMIGDFSEDVPEYIALINEQFLLDNKKNVVLSTYVDDDKFDTIDGLYIAIIYKDIELLKYYKQKFINVKYAITFDYSVFGNFKESTIIHQMEKACVVNGWLRFELGIIVYPNVSYANEKHLN